MCFSGPFLIGFDVLWTATAIYGRHWLCSATVHAHRMEEKGKAKKALKTWLLSRTFNVALFQRAFWEQHADVKRATFGTSTFYVKK